MQNADVFGGFCRASSQQQTLQGGNIIYHKIRRAGGKRGLVMRAPGNGAGFDAGGVPHFDIRGGVADVKGGSGVAVKRGEGEPDAFGMRFVVLHRVRADEYVDVCADAELFAVGAQDGGFFAANDAGLPPLRLEGGEQGGNAGVEADMVFRRHGVMLAEGGEQCGKGVVVKGGRAEGAEAALYRDAHLLDDSGVCWRGQVMVAEGLSGGEDGALGAVGGGRILRKICKLFFQIP